MKLVFAGTPANAANTLRALAAVHQVELVITRSDAPVGRKRVMTPSPVAQAAQELGIATLKTNALDAADLAQILKTGAQYGIVVAYGALIKPPILDALKWWNIHFSLLPAWRGASPLQQAILSGGEGAGVTVFHLEAGLDTGPIIASAPMQLESTATFGEELERHTQVGIQLVLDALKSQPVAIPQRGQPTYAGKIARADARLDFSQSAEALGKMVRAFNPEPMAWAIIDGVETRILRGQALSSEASATEFTDLQGASLGVGELATIAGRVLVGAKDGTIFELLEVQPAGKKPMPSIDWWRGLRPGAKFD